jgi:hypothetical protein
MTFKDASSYHPQAAKQTLACADLTVAWKETSQSDLSGDKFIYRAMDSDFFDHYLLLIWDAPRRALFGNSLIPPD